jgi:hypothetical protein
MKASQVYNLYDSYKHNRNHVKRLIYKAKETRLREGGWEDPRYRFICYRVNCEICNERRIKPY